MKAQTRKRAQRYVFVLAALVVVIVFLFPVYWMVTTSFKAPNEIFAYPPTFFPRELTVRGYEFQLRTASQIPMQVSLLNSVAIGALTVAIAMFFAISSAYGIARFKLKFGRMIFLGFLVVQMLPNVVFLAPLFIIFRSIHLINTYMAPAVFAGIFATPFCVVILRPYFLAVPKELEEAGRLDGCSSVGVFLRVVVPVASSGIAVVVALSFILGWGDLMGSLTFLQTDRLFPLTVTMYKAISEYGIDWNKLMAYGVALSVPILILFLSLQRYIVFGLTEGAIKG